MPPIDIVCDTSVALTWFHAEGELEVEASRELLGVRRRHALELFVLDLTHYEVANVLVRGRFRLEPAQVSAVLEALALIPRIALTPAELDAAVRVAHDAGLTVYDAACTAAAQARDAALATLDRELLSAGLGERPSDILARISDRGLREPGAGPRVTA